MSGDLSKNILFGESTHKYKTFGPSRFCERNVNFLWKNTQNFEFYHYFKWRISLVVGWLLVFNALKKERVVEFRPFVYHLTW